MKNTASKIKLAVLAALSCACAVAWAENVFYIHPLDPSDTNSDSDAFGTKTAFADKIGSSLSFAIWVKHFTGRGDRVKFIAGVPDRWYLAIPNGYGANLTFYTQSGSAAVTTGHVVNDDNWHFLVCTFNYDSETPANSFQRLYVDGQLAAEKTDGITAITTPDKMFSLGAPSTSLSNIGAFDSNVKKNVFGHFSELTIWSRALTSEEISQFYSRRARVSGNESGLVAWYPLTGRPGMAATEYRFANLAAVNGDPMLYSYWIAYSDTNRVAIVGDDNLTLPYARFVASPEWCAEHSYEQSADATGRSWSDPLTNLVETAAAARKFERILCSPGTHKISSSISPLVDEFYLGSCDPITGKPCPETAIIDAQELCRHFISSDQTTGHQSNFTVENLTFVNGSADNGGSMYFRSKTGKINNCIFHDNTATANGGAYYAYTANGTVVSNCRFYGNNAANFGGSVFLQQNSESTGDFQRFVDCVFSNNEVTATSGNRYGGAIYCSRKVELKNCLFADNKGLGYGGHAYVGVNSDIKGCTFTGSCNASYGSCLYISKGPVTITDCVFTNNSNNSSLVYYSYSGCRNLLFRQCLIADNASDKQVLPNVAGATFTFENCTIAQAKVTPDSPSAATTNTFINCIMPNATITSAGSYCNILSN